MATATGWSVLNGGRKAASSHLSTCMARLLPYHHLRLHASQCDAACAGRGSHPLKTDGASRLGPASPLSGRDDAWITTQRYPSAAACSWPEATSCCIDMSNGDSVMQVLH